MNENNPLVCVIDDESSIRESLSNLLRSVGLKVQTFASAQEFLTKRPREALSCLVLDVQLPGISGLDLQQELVRGDAQMPTIFIPGHGDIPMSVRAMKAGAIEFLTKPFRDEDLLDAIQAALRRDRARLEDERKVADLRTRQESRTARERQVMALLVAGRVNKQIAAEIAISEVTVRLHRGQIMRKMRASSLADLIRIADKIKL